MTAVQSGPHYHPSIVKEKKGFVKMVTVNEAGGGVPRALHSRRALRRSLESWKRGTVGLLALAVLGSAAQGLAFRRLRGQWEQALEQAQEGRRAAVHELADLSLAMVRERQARAAQAAAYEEIGAWEYVGECQVTAYCCEPYAHICGTGDGLTATGIPITPGIAAVDPAVIPLGSTLVIDGQRYLAADVGGAVKGHMVDVAVSSHQEAIGYGVQNAPVWVIKEGQP